jgi:hypothetical protein
MNKRLNCHPKKKTKKFCISDGTLLNIKKKWNNNNITKITKNKPNEIIETLFKLNNCKHDKCLLDKFVKDNIELYKSEIENFAPFAPSSWRQNNKHWLNSLDIKHVMNQYKEATPTFDFIGPTPIDWYYKKDTHCVCNNLCKLDLNEKTEKGIEKIGIVFNTHEHYKPGEHWVALLINIPEKIIYYYDSEGLRCPTRIKKVYHMLNKTNDFKFRSNYNVIHQKKDGNCGIYCIFFLIHMLKQNDYSIFTKNTMILSDKQMTQKRKQYFNI